MEIKCLKLNDLTEAVCENNFNDTSNKPYDSKKNKKYSFMKMKINLNLIKPNSAVLTNTPLKKIEKHT